jgi:hypothetical protein
MAIIPSSGATVIGNAVRIYTNAGAPTNGTSGTYAGIAGKGSILVDTTNATAYQNTNTLASPTWSAFPVASGELTSLLAAIPTTAVPSVASANATNPANVAYTQADQTALAALANETKAQLNALLVQLRTAGIVTP